jgi:hypothetical protein
MDEIGDVVKLGLLAEAASVAVYGAAAYPAIGEGESLKLFSKPREGPWRNIVQGPVSDFGFLVPRSP